MPVPAVLLDTSVVIDVEKVDRGAYSDSVAVISAITVGELAFGVDGPDMQAREARLSQVLRGYEVLPYGVEAAKIYGVLAGMLRGIGRNPRPRRLDLQIAATAAAARLPLLTLNPTDFRGLARMVEVVAITYAP